MLWEIDRLGKGRRRVSFDPSLPSRFGFLPRHGTNADVRKVQDFFAEVAQYLWDARPERF